MKFKKIICVLLSSLFIFGFAINVNAYETSGKGNELYYGDANGDGYINASDALLVLRYSIGLDKLAENTDLSDVNRDGSTNASDALLILRYSIGFDNTGYTGQRYM